MSKTATLVRKLDGGTGEMRLYKLDPPLSITDWENEPTGEAEFVVVSATIAPYTALRALPWPIYLGLAAMWAAFWEASRRAR